MGFMLNYWPTPLLPTLDEYKANALIHFLPITAVIRDKDWISIGAPAFHPSDCSVVLSELCNQFVCHLHLVCHIVMVFFFGVWYTDMNNEQPVSSRSEVDTHSTFLCVGYGSSSTQMSSSGSSLRFTVTVATTVCVCKSVHVYTSLFLCPALFLTLCGALSRE